MRTIHFDDSRWPLVVVRYLDKVDETEFDELLALLDVNIKRSIERRSKTTIIYDSRSSYQASPRVRSKQAEWMKKNAELTRKHCAGLAFVITSTMVRGVLTAILWLSDMPAPYVVVATIGEAEEWCAGRLAEHNIQIPAARFSKQA